MRAYVTTSTIASFKYKTGTIVATDTHGSYGSLSKFNNLTRTFKVTSNCIVSYSGEYSDISYLHSFLKHELSKDSEEIDPQGVHKLLQRLMYLRRSKMKPLNVFCSVIGKVEPSKTNNESNKSIKDTKDSYKINHDSKFTGSGYFNKNDRGSTDSSGRIVGAVNSLGNFYFSDVVCDGIGAYMVTPFLRDRIEGRVDEIEREEAIKIMEEAMKLLVYRDCYALNSVVIGIVEDDYCFVDTVPRKLDTNWELEREVIEN